MTEQEKEEYLNIFRRNWDHKYDEEEFRKCINNYYIKYPHLYKKSEHRTEDEIMAAAESKRIMKIKNPDPQSLYQHAYGEKKIIPELRNWSPYYPIPEGYQTLDSRLFTHIETGDQIFVTTDKPSRSLYREYLMTHHSKRAEQYPNGPPPDDRTPNLCPPTPKKG